MNAAACSRPELSPPVHHFRRPRSTGRAGAPPAYHSCAHQPEGILDFRLSGYLRRWKPGASPEWTDFALAANLLRPLAYRTGRDGGGAGRRICAVLVSSLARAQVTMRLLTGCCRTLTDHAFRYGGRVSRWCWDVTPCPVPMRGIDKMGSGRASPRTTAVTLYESLQRLDRHHAYSKAEHGHGLGLSIADGRAGCLWQTRIGVRFTGRGIGSQ